MELAWWGFRSGASFWIVMRRGYFVSEPCLVVGNAYLGRLWRELEKHQDPLSRASLERGSGEEGWEGEDGLVARHLHAVSGLGVLRADG